jgi:peptidoglycan/xylan/chitin deacetylase (PgdA/CDA1 family)
MILKYISFSILLTILSGTPASDHQTHINPTIHVAQFKNNADGAYTIIHDDFGGQWASGIEDYADTMAYHRGIPFCFALIAGQCEDSDWEKANELISHGHQVLNHSMSHKCGKDFEWCKAGLWNEKDFSVEIDSSNDLIKSNTGKHPAFFMFPFDLHTDTMISYLQYKGYAGSRAGSFDILEEASINDPFRLNFKTYPPGQKGSDLDSFAKEAMVKKGWAIREVHGVNDGSWGAISLKEYENHLNYLKSLSEAGHIWVATLSDVVFYRLLKEKYICTITETDKKNRVTRIDFSAAKETRERWDSKMFSTAQATTKVQSLTIVLTQKGTPDKAVQNGKDISISKKGLEVLIEANPAEGPVTLFYN